MSDLVPTDPNPWIQNLPLILSGIGVAQALAFTAHKLEQERGARAQRMQIVQDAKTQTEFWKVRIDVSEKLLSGNELAAAKAEARAAIDRIRDDADTNLRTLQLGRQKAVVVGLPVWRRLLLFYKPTGSMLEGVLWRVGYWFSLVLFLFVLLFTLFLFVEIWKYPNLLSRSGPKGLRGSAMLLCVSIPVCALNVIGYFTSGRREIWKPSMRLVDRL